MVQYSSVRPQFAVTVEFYDRISTVFRFGTFRGNDKFFTVDSTLRFYIQITDYGFRYAVVAVMELAEFVEHTFQI